MADSIAVWLRWLESSSLAVSIRQSLWLYPLVEIIHILGIVLVAGGAVLFDLRLLGLSRKIPLADMAAYLLSWSKRGLLLAIPSGILLFITNAETLGYDPTFHIKLILLLLAALNAWIFHVFVFPSHLNKAQNAGRPKSAKANALFSIIVWISIITCGRLLAY